MNCKLCGRKTRLLQTGIRGDKDGNVWYCLDCDLAFLEKFYDSMKYQTREYRHTHTASMKLETPQQIHDSEAPYQGRRLRIAENYVVGNHSAIEIGAGGGCFAKMASLWFSPYHVIDSDPECAKFIRERFNIVTDTEPFRKSIFKRNKYDIAFAFSVLEHVDNPVQFINDIDAKYFIIDVPNLADHLCKHSEQYRKTSFFQEAHNWYFSEKALRLVAEKAGYRVIEVHYLQFYPLLNQLWWFMNDRRWKWHRTNHLPYPDNPVAEKINELVDYINPAFVEYLTIIGQTDQILVVLKKEGV